ncbi:ATP-binding protein [Desulfosporosinus sp. FKB]|uniref:two-component system sensor histidine kinase NtrB n=1 Tax=Desulfosporosinus sp. FKB TaxID=1969835 RepID=UPI001483A552|nr:ATP-binding protein [Desulfosporosinus sp. FKB]
MMENQNKLVDCSLYIYPEKNMIKSKFLSKSHGFIGKRDNTRHNRQHYLNRLDRVSGLRRETIESLSEISVQEPSGLKRDIRRDNLLRNYRKLFDHFHDSLLIVNLEGQILEANRAALKAYGYTREELSCMKVHDLRAEETKDLIHDQLRQAIEKGITFQTYHVRRNRERFSVEVNSQQIMIRSEKLLVSIIRNSSEQKCLKMASLNREDLTILEKIASGLAHEIRNSITGVHGFLQLAIRQKLTQDKFAEHCTLMLQELNRANYILSQLILASNDKVLNLELKNLNQLLRTMIPSIQVTAEAQGKIIKCYLEEIPDIFLDENEIKELIRNLVDNALDSITTGGTVTITTTSSNKLLVLQIQDNGPGIIPEILNQLGTPFLTTKERGIGLGLVICENIVARHKGTINFQTSNLGTTVRVSFSL